MKECILNHMKDPHIIQGLCPNCGALFSRRNAAQQHLSKLDVSEESQFETLRATHAPSSQSAPEIHNMEA